jgi:hypothetical protein
MGHGSYQYNICPICHAAVPEQHPTLKHWRKCPICAYCYDERKLKDAISKREKCESCKQKHRDTCRGRVPPETSRCDCIFEGWPFEEEGKKENSKEKDSKKESKKKRLLK